jgi:tetratricopeptide (TPR) repeat protein
MKSFKRAGIIACLVFCAACAQVAVEAVTPILAAFASHLDQRTASAITEMEKKQDWAGMLKLAQAQLAREPTRMDWWFLQGYALARQGQHAAAIDSYERAIRISPEDEASWLALGQSQSELGQKERAIQTYRQALRYRPESAPAYLALADVYLQKGQVELAIFNYRENVRYDPSSVQGWYSLAAAYHSAGQGERRDEALQGLRKLDPAAADQFEKQYRSK